jgi:hypothetical protein
MKTGITLDGQEPMIKTKVIEFCNSELEVCYKARERAEVERSKIKGDVSMPGFVNLTGTILHYEGRIRQLRRMLQFITHGIDK